MTNNNAFNLKKSREAPLPLLDTPKSFVIIDPASMLNILRDAEHLTNYELSEQDVFTFLFENVWAKDKALENVEYGLMDIASKHMELGMFGSISHSTDEILKAIRTLALRLITLLDHYGCYRNNKLMFKPKTAINTLETNRILLSPMILIEESVL